MDLTALSVATAIALASTIIFLLIIKSWAIFTKNAASTQFPESIMLEPAQRFRDELARNGHEQSIYLVCALVFVVVFCIVYLFPTPGLFDNVPDWQLYVVLALFGIAAGFFAYKIAHVIAARRKLVFYRDASMATGHGLQKITINQNRVFHDVPGAAGVIDNVVVGLQGIYTVSVIARKAGKNDRATLKGDRLSFGDKHVVSVKRSAQKAQQLAKEIRKVTGHDIRVRSVIAIPGWQIESQQSSDFLVVNERNLAMLTGWKDQKDFLMNEDVEAVQKLLTERCTRFATK